MGLESAYDVTHRKFARRIWGIYEKSQLSWELDTEPEGSTFGARWGQTNLRATGTARDGGGRWKSQNRKNVYLSPYVEEPLSSRVIKSFVPELRRRKCFSCFEIPIFYLYIMNILCIFHVAISWLCSTVTHQFLSYCWLHMVSSWLRKEAKGTPQKQSQTPTTLMT